MKAQGLSVNTMIILALAVIVLIVVATMIIQRTGQISQSNNCERKLGVCAQECGRGIALNQPTEIYGSCAEENQVCCI